MKTLAILAVLAYCAVHIESRSDRSETLYREAGELQGRLQASVSDLAIFHEKVQQALAIELSELDVQPQIQRYLDDAHITINVSIDAAVLKGHNPDNCQTVIQAVDTVASNPEFANDLTKCDDEAREELEPFLVNIMETLKYQKQFADTIVTFYTDCDQYDEPKMEECLEEKLEYYKTLVDQQELIAENLKKSKDSLVKKIYRSTQLCYMFPLFNILGKIVQAKVTALDCIRGDVF